MACFYGDTKTGDFWLLMLPYLEKNNVRCYKLNHFNPWNYVSELLCIRVCQCILLLWLPKVTLALQDRKKWGFFQMRWFLTLPLISLLPFLSVTGRTAWFSSASVTVGCVQCFQRITLQVAKENHCKGKVCSTRVSVQLPNYSLREQNFFQL